MSNKIRRALARIRFAMEKIPYQVMYYTLGNPMIRMGILKSLASFPRLEKFLREFAVRIRQRYVKKRISYQRSIHPTMKIKNSNGQKKNYSVEFNLDPHKAPSIDEILQRINKEL